MNTFAQWVAALGNLSGSKYAAEPDMLARLQWLWRDYCDATFHHAVPSVTLPESYLDTKVESIWNAQVAIGNAKGRPTAAQLDLFSQTLIASYRKDNIPTTDDDTLCIYHAFSHEIGRAHV